MMNRMGEVQFVSNGETCRKRLKQGGGNILYGSALFFVRVGGDIVFLLRGGALVLAEVVPG